MQRNKSTAATPAKLLTRALLCHVPVENRGATLKAISDGLGQLRVMDSSDWVQLAELTAELQETYPENPDVKENLHGFVRRAIATGDGEVENSRDLVRLCRDYPRLGDFALQEVSAHLSQSIGTIPLDALVESSNSSQYDAINASRRSSGEITNNTISYLTFLKGYLWLPGTQIADIPAELGEMLLEMMFVPDDQLFQSARATLFAFIAKLQTAGFDSSRARAENFSRRLWRRMLELASGSRVSNRKATAYQIWLRWVDLQGPTGPGQAMFEDDRYWRLLQAGLRDGYTEQRKNCLYILQKSLSLIQEDVKVESIEFKVADRRMYEAIYAKFCTVFDTILLGRYFNQVQECMGDLQALASDNSKLGKSWLLTMLSAIYEMEGQDGIKKLVSEWFLRYRFNPEDTPKRYQRFLRHSLLPWITVGHLFTSTLRPDTKHAVSEHGERLATYIRTLLSNCNADALRRDYLLVFLEYLRDEENHYYPFSGVCVLDGVSPFGRCLETSDVPLVTKIASSVGLPEIARDFYTAVCYRLLEQIKDINSENADHAPGLDERWRLLSKGSSEQSTPTTHGSLEGLRNRSLKGRGLAEACHVLQQALHAEGNAIEAQHLQPVLAAIWEELQIRDYPRNLILQFPSLLLHERCLERCLIDSNLLAFVSTIIPQSLELAQSRSYCFSSLARALRNAYLGFPDVALRLPLLDFFVGVAKTPPIPRQEYLAEAATAAKLQTFVPRKSYESYYGKSEGYGLACCFDILNRLRDADLPFARQLLEKLMFKWIMQKPPFRVVSKWKNAVQLQMVALTLEVLAPSMTVTEIHAIIKQLKKILFIESLPRYRFLLEWTIARLHMKDEEGRHDILRKLNQENDNHKYRASLVRISSFLCRLPGSDDKFTEKFMMVLTRLAASSKVVIRFAAHTSYPLAYELAQKEGWTEVYRHPAFRSLYEYLRHTERYRSNPAELQCDKLHPVRDNTLTTLLHGPYQAFDPPEPQTIRPEHFDEVFGDTPAHISSTTQPPRLPLGDRPQLPMHSARRMEPTSGDANKPSRSETAELTYLQTKGLTWQQDTTSTHLIPSAPIDSLTKDLPRFSHSFIIVASLLDNAHNIGGLSRAGEVFGARCLTIANPSTLTNSQFTNVAVSSHYWLPISHVPAKELVEYLVARKAEGYKVVGVEQTDRSLILGSPGAEIPRKCVLVMGNEKEGIPSWALKELDLCLEIRQRGQVRSLNVQTAAAVVMFEYERQWGTKPATA